MPLQKGNGATFSTTGKRKSSPKKTVCPAPTPIRVLPALPTLDQQVQVQLGSQPSPIQDIAPEEIQFSDLPTDIQKYIMTIGLKQSPQFSTYTDKLLFGKMTLPGLEKDLSYVEPETIEIRPTARVLIPGILSGLENTFTDVSLFQQFVAKTGLPNLEQHAIIFRGKGIHMNIIIPKELQDGDNIGSIYINVVKPSTTSVLAVLHLQYYRVKGDIRNIMISKLRLQLILREGIEIDDMKYLTDIYVGLMWLYYVFHTISFDKCFLFETLDNIRIEYYHEGVPFPMLVNTKEQDPIVKRRLLLFLAHIEKMLKIKSIRARKNKKGALTLAYSP